MYSVTSCSGLIHTSTASAPSVNSCARVVYSGARTRAILVGVRYSACAISQATILTSSLLVSATSTSVSAMPAASSTVGYEAWPATARTSSRACRSRRMSSLVSTTVTSLAGSRDRWYAAVRPTWPAPRIRIFISACAPSPLHHFQISVLQHEPFGALLLEIHLYARVRSLALDRQHDAFAKLAVAHPGAKSHAVAQRLHQRRAAECPVAAGGSNATRRGMRDANPRPHLLDHRRRDFLDEARRRVEA